MQVGHQGLPVGTEHVAEPTAGLPVTDSDRRLVTLPSPNDQLAIRSASQLAVSSAASWPSADALGPKISGVSIPARPKRNDAVRPKPRATRRSNVSVHDPHDLAH